MTDAEAKAAWNEAVVIAGRIMRLAAEMVSGGLPPNVGAIPLSDAGALAERVLAVNQYHAENPDDDEA